MPSIHEYFENYAEVSINGNPKELAEFYGENFVVVGPEGSMAFSNDEKFLKWLKDVRIFNNETGLEKMIVRKVSNTPVGKHIIQATLTWGAIFKNTKDEIIEFDIHYILENFGSKMKIILYITEVDQEQLMKEKGLI